RPNRSSSSPHTRNLPRREAYRPQPMQTVTAAAATNGQDDTVTTPCTTLATISTAGMGKRSGASIPYDPCSRVGTPGVTTIPTSRAATDSESHTPVHSPDGSTYFDEPLDFPTPP